MDHLWMTVSIIAISVAIKSIGEAIVSLRRISNGPKELAGHLSETDDLHWILLQIHWVLEHNRPEDLSQHNFQRCRAIEPTKKQLANADEVIVELDRLDQICSKLTDSGHNG